MDQIIKGLIILLFTAVTAGAQVPEPAPSQSKPVALMNGIIHVGNGEVFENGMLIFEEGKITSVGDARNVKIDLTEYDVYQVAGSHIYPGLIVANSQVGLDDIISVRASQDHTEVGEFNPNVHALVAYNTDSEIIPTLRFNGILLAQIVPDGGLISGTSSVVALDGWNWEDAAYARDIGIHLHWPPMMRPPKISEGEIDWVKNENYDDQVQSIEKFLNEAAAYRILKDREPVNLKLEAMKGIFEGRQQLFLHADGKKEIVTGINSISRCGIKKVVLIGGTDAYYVMDLLKERDIPVLLDELHRLPGRDFEDIDLPYKLPALLQEKGILVGLTYRDELQSSRNLPFFAGTAAAYGLSGEEALQMITSNTARILAIDHLTGTLEAGKDANIVISSGDLLDMRTNRVEYAFIRGRKLNLKGKQQELYERFRRKYEEGN
ncbi:MAG: amidohydrolase family protein [Cyclobacteriaceae bacterium]|nr:amidohydrolase family protein [Cyclobacteriaceae bacterium]